MTQLIPVLISPIRITYAMLLLTLGVNWSVPFGVGEYPDVAIILVVGAVVASPRGGFRGHAAHDCLLFGCV